jgi:hypothetical protein
MDDPQGSTSQKRAPPWWSCLPGPAAWLLRISSPHPREPMRKGLTKGSVAGFYIIMPTSKEKIIKKINDFILVFINHQSSMHPKRWNQPPCTLHPGRTASSITSQDQIIELVNFNFDELCVLYLFNSLLFLLAFYCFKN